MMRPKEILRPLLLLSAIAVCAQAPAWCLGLERSLKLQDDEKAEAEAEGDGEDESSEKAKQEEKQDSYFALMGGDVHTGLGGVLRGATILSKNGVIEEIGYDLFLPQGTEWLDVSGMRVYPGMVSLNSSTQITEGTFFADPDEEHGPNGEQVNPLDWDSHYGLDETGFAEGKAGLGHVDPETGDGPHDAPPVAGIEGAFDPELASRINDSFDPFSAYLVLSLATGITTVDQAGAAVKLKRDDIKDVLMKDGNLVTLRWSISSPSSIRDIKQKFKASAEHLRELRAWEAMSSTERKESGQEKEPKKPKDADSNVLKVLTGEQLGRFNSDDREELLGIARFAQQYSFKPVIFGCIEGWTVAEELGRAGAIAVVTPRARRPKSETLVRAGGSSIENAAILHASGVQVAIIPESTGFALQGMTGRDLLHLPTEAAFGVRGGLSEAAAFAAISMIPARILGVDHRVGTLEKGKDMDAIVLDGDVLHYESFVQWAVVAGKLAYDKQDELYFAHIRPQADRPKLEVIDGEGQEPAAETTEPAEEDSEEEKSTEEKESDDEEKPEDEQEPEDGSSALERGAQG